MTLRLRLLDLACTALRVDDVPRGNGWRWRLTLWLLEERYQTALAMRGREYARRFDYIPF